MESIPFFDNPLDVIALAVWGIIAIILIFQSKDIFVFVPQRYAYVVERWGKYKASLGAGPHLLLPFMDKVAHKQDLREQTIVVPPQECFTSDNVKVQVDGVMYVSVTDPHAASYGVTDYKFAAVQLAQTTTRSVIGTIDLDRTFEERDLISSRVVSDVNEAGLNWGIRVHRYEIKNISTPNTVRNAMEQEVTAERERRALVARAEGDKQSRINRSEGQKRELINKSEGEMRARINEAEGQAAEIRAIAEATAQSIEKLAEAITGPGGEESVRMQLIERYFKSISNLAKSNTQIVLPANLTNLDSLIEQLGLSEGILTDEERSEAQAQANRLRHSVTTTPASSRPAAALPAPQPQVAFRPDVILQEAIAQQQPAVRPPPPTRQPPTRQPTAAPSAIGQDNALSTLFPNPSKD
ncbi:MAG: paraslipin [Myxococcales bacterium]|jgi:regulator of protease activity HflC (stomatin/prohibitin superfamily)|nr:paraslipin [Myxococcales bacterium]